MWSGMWKMYWSVVYGFFARKAAALLSGDLDL
jgi:hypothetical protein